MKIPIPARPVAPFAALLLSAACYNMVPLTAEQPHPARELRLELTAAGAERLSGVLGPTIVAVRGRPLEWRSDTVAVAMVATATASGEEQYWRSERVAIPRDAIARAYEKQFARGRTTAAVVGLLGIAVLTGDAISGSGRGTPRPPTLPPGQ